MWPSCVFVALCCVVYVSSLPVVPLSVSGVEKLEQLATGGQDGGLRTFIVQVQEPQKQEAHAVKPEEQQVRQQPREFPWPYPPVFEPLLPMEAKQRLTAIYVDSSLTPEQRESQVDAVFDSLPQQIIELLPLPAEYERLPADVYKRIFYIHTAPGFKWAERQQLIRDIVEALPVEQKQLMHSPRIGGPPPGFELVLAPTVYKQLLTVHHNPRLSKEEKSNIITQIMRQVPLEQINRLPLPAGMDQLPMELQARARALVYDYSVPQVIRAQRVRQFVAELPAELRPQLR